MLSQLIALARIPQLALVAALASGAMIFLPSEWLKYLGVDRVRELWRTELGIVFVVSACVVLTVIVSHVTREVLAFRRMRARRVYLHKLTPDEKAALVPYIHGGATAVNYNYTDGVVQGLEARDILYRSSQVGILFEFPYNLQLWAREYLEKNPRLLDGASAPRSSRLAMQDRW
jgi:Super-infection exclusion protein B